MNEYFDLLWQNKEYREQLAGECLRRFIKDEIRLRDEDLRLIKMSVSILLCEDYLDQKTAPSVEGGAVWLNQ